MNSLFNFFIRICRSEVLTRELEMVFGVGDAMPAVNLFEGSPDGKVDLPSLCAGKKVVLFAVPGAFTPGCSKTHLPGYVEQAEVIKGKGVDEIVCVSVNDPFVMAAWGKEQAADGKVLRF